MKMAPHRRFGGSNVAEIFIFLISNKICPLFVEEIFFSIGCSKSYRPAQLLAEKVSCSFFWHQSFSKVPSNFHPLAAEWSNRLSTPLEGPRPPRFIDRVPLNPNKTIVFKNKNFMKKHGEKQLLPGCCLMPARKLQNPLVNYPVIFAFWQLSKATA